MIETMTIKDVFELARAALDFEIEEETIEVYNLEHEEEPDLAEIDRHQKYLMHMKESKIALAKARLRWVK